MNAIPAAYALAAVQAVIIVLLAADRWVHRVTGSAPLEAQIIELRKMVEKSNDRWSEKMTELTKYLEERRSEVDILRAQASELEGEMRGIRGYRKEEYFDRRKEPRDP